MKQSAANFHRLTTKVSRAAPRWDKHDSTGSDIGRPQVVAASLEMLSGRSKKEYAKEAQAVAEAPDAAPAALAPAYAANLSQSMYQSGGCSRRASPTWCLRACAPTGVYPAG